MSFRTIVVVACCLSVPARSQCTPDREKQIVQTMNAWLQDWNEKRMDDLMKLYSPHAVLLPADGSRASEKGEIRAYLERQIGTKMELNSPGPGYGCAGKDVPALAVETGTYKQRGTGKTIEGQYLVVLLNLPNYPGPPIWVITQQALTEKPQSQILSRNPDAGTR